MSLLGGSGKINTDGPRINVDGQGRIIGATLGGSAVNAVTGITMPYDPLVSISNSTTTAAPVEMIQGEMVQVYHEVDITQMSLQDQESMDRLQSQMKESLTEMLVKRLISQKKIEFTKTIEDSQNFDSKRVRFRARVFVTPDDKVRVFRLNGKDA